MVSAPRTGSWRRIATLVLALGIAALATTESPAQSGSNGPLQEKYEKKLTEPFVKAIRWATTLEEALERARKENKPILGYFTRSYAP